MNPWRLAWRNLSRNSARSWICGVALAVTTVVLVVMRGLMDGMEDFIAHDAIDLGVGEVQIHAKSYALEQSIYETLLTADPIMATARSNGIDSAARALGAGLLSHTEKSSGAHIWGVDPGAERTLGKLPVHLRAGTFLPDKNDNRVVLGCDLARLIGAHVGEKVALIVQATDASTSTELMTVDGILESVGDIDQSVALIDRRDFDGLFLTHGKVHEVALSSHFRLPPEKIVAAVTGAAGRDVDVKTWHELLPAVDDIVDVFQGAAGFLSAIFFVAAAIGLLNTMLMATSERVREFGILKALGASPGRIVKDVTREAFILGVLSAVAGGVIGGACTLLLERHGIDISSFGKLSVAGVGFDPVWRAHVSANGVCGPIFGMMFVTVLAALYPAFVAGRLVPVDAINHV